MTYQQIMTLGTRSTTIESSVDSHSFIQDPCTGVTAREPGYMSVAEAISDGWRVLAVPDVRGSRPFTWWLDRTVARGAGASPEASSLGREEVSLNLRNIGERLATVGRFDEPHSLMSVLGHLADAADYFLRDQQRGPDGWEAWDQALVSARTMLAEWSAIPAMDDAVSAIEPIPIAEIARRQNERIGSGVRAMRMRLGFTYDQLSRAANLATARLSEIERYPRYLPGYSAAPTTDGELQSILGALVPATASGMTGQGAGRAGFLVELSDLIDSDPWDCSAEDAARMAQRCAMLTQGRDPWSKECKECLADSRDLVDGICATCREATDEQAAEAP